MTEFKEEVVEYDEYTNEPKKEKKVVKKQRPKKITTARPETKTRPLTELEKLQKRSEEQKAINKEREEAEEAGKAAQKKKKKDLKEWKERDAFFVMPKANCGNCGAEVDLQNAVLYASQLMGTRKIGLIGHLGSIQCPKCQAQNFVLGWTADTRGHSFISDGLVLKGLKEFGIRPRDGVPSDKANKHFNKCLAKLFPKHGNRYIRFK